MDALYSIRTFLIMMFVLALMIAPKKKAPVERLLIMMLDLQIMSSYALLSVTMPANYIAMTVILRPFVSLNVFRQILGNFDYIKLEEESSETPLAFLG